MLAQKYLQDAYHYSPGRGDHAADPRRPDRVGAGDPAGRLSDRVGRKPMAFTIVALAGIGFFLFYNGAPGWAIPPLWMLAFFCFFSGDVLIAGFALEIVPTQYRATVSRPALSGGNRMRAPWRWRWKALLYDGWAAHGPAIQWLAGQHPHHSDWPSCSCPNQRARRWRK